MRLFTVLLDYVSRAHEIEIRLSSVVRPSVCGIDYLRSYCMDCLQILFVASPGQYAKTFFLFLGGEKNIFDIFYDYFSFSLTWDIMGAKMSKRYSSNNRSRKCSNFFFNFLHNGPHKITLGIEILKIKIFTNFFRFR